MATYAQAKQEYNELLSRFNQLRSSVDNYLDLVNNRGGEIRDVAPTILSIRSSIEVQLAQVQFLQDVTIPDATDGSEAQLNELYFLTGSLRDDYNNLLNDTFEVTKKAGENFRNRDLLDTQPKNSAGDIVENEQAARDNDANLQSPPQGRFAMDDDDNVVPQPTNTNTGTNAREPNVENDDASNTDESNIGNQAQGGATSKVGGDKPPVKAEQTQRADNAPPAVTAPNEDEITPQQSSTATSVGSDGRPTVAKEFIEPILPKANLLSGLSSMTYGLSLYLMNPDEFGTFVANEQKVLPTDNLLIQSAGINKAERNQWFNVDFYIEDFTLESVVGTQAVGSPHNVITLEFTVVEPQGITFLNRLNNAVIEHIGNSGKKISAGAQNYMMVVRFYGYDAAGRMVTAADLGLPTTSDSEAIIEKYIPFTITGFNYKIQTKATEYRIKGAALGTNIAFSTARGVVPFNIQITAGSVDQLFNGNLVLNESQNENTANAGNNQTGTTQTVVRGLVEALNEQQLRLAGESYDIPDQYEVIFQDPDIKNAKIVKPGNVNKSRASNQTAESAARKFLTSKLNYDKESQTYNVLAGTQIVQLLDLVLRTSSYITSQQNVYYDEKTGKPEVKSSVPTVQWYRIKTQVTPIGYDTKRNAMAYKISYIVNKYQINTPRSPYFPNSEYRGVHKLYEYWFTGKNTEVLDFEIDVNYNYFTTIGNDGRIDTSEQGQIVTSQQYSVAPGQSLQNGERGSSVPAANLSDRLYSEADVAYSSIEIVGDPDWIQQSELVYNRSLSLSPFLPDGGVNYDSSEVLFEIRFNPVQDYDLETGLSRVDENNRELTIAGPNGQTISEADVAQESLVFTALTVTSSFSEGKFTQKLQGVYRPLNGTKNAPVNPRSQTVLSTGNSVERTLTDTTTVGGVETNAGGAGNRAKAQQQRANLNSGTPKTSVTTRTSQASETAGGASNRARAQEQRLNVNASANQSVNDDAGTETTRRIGGRSAAARRR